MKENFVIRINTNNHIRPETNQLTYRKNIVFEVEATDPMEAFNQIEHYVDEYDHITIGCPWRRGTVKKYPAFITATADTENGARTYNWKDAG